MSPWRLGIRLRDVLGSLLTLASISGCGLETGKVSIRFPAYSPGNGNRLEMAASAGTSELGCEPDLVITAEPVSGDFEPEDRTEADFFELSFLFHRYFDPTSTVPMLVSGSERSVVAFDLSTDTPWEFSGTGAVILRAQAQAGASLIDGAESFNSVTGIFRGGNTLSNFQSTEWECGAAAAWNSGNLLDSLSPSPSDISQVVIPVRAEASDPVTPQEGQTQSVTLQMTAAKIPFGLYSLTDLETHGLASAGSVNESALDPFRLLGTLDSGSTLSDIYGSGSAMTVVPLLKDLDTGEVWRGAGGPLAHYASGGAAVTFPLYFYPIPAPKRYRLGVLLQCSIASCVKFEGFALQAGQIICAYADIDFSQAEATGVTPLSQGSTVAWFAPMDQSQASAWSYHFDATQGADEVPAACVSAFF